MAIRNKSYWNYNNLNSKDPVAIGLFTQKELQSIESGEALKSQKIYNKLMNKAQVWGHRRTQGGVDLLDLPFP